MPSRRPWSRGLRIRLARQSVLDRAELRVVILESVLHREVGEQATMCEQVQHLMTVGSRSSVMLQVVAETPAVAGALGDAFAIAAEGAVDVAAYAESNIQGAVYTDPDRIAPMPAQHVVALPPQMRQ